MATKKKEELEHEAAKKKEESNKKLRLCLAKLSDRAGPVTLKMLKETDAAIQDWRYGEGKSEAGMSVHKEHMDLHLGLDTTFARLRFRDKMSENDPIPKEDWKKIKQLKQALMDKLG